MANLSVKYMGFDLKSPLILGSCGLSNDIEKLKLAEQSGFGAVVLKSIFEEQIKNEMLSSYQKSQDYQHSQAYVYLTQYQEMASFEKYLAFIRQAKANISIPVIASVNCFSSDGWTQYAKAIEEAGADALEVNYFSLPISFEKKGKEYSESYIRLIDKLKKKTSLPIALKTSNYFTDFAHFMQKLSYTGIKSLVLFNRFYSPDINIDKIELTSSAHLSSKEEIANTLRWTGILSEHLRCDLCATTGCHDSESMIKLILAGADAVQAASVFYKKGIEYGKTMLDELNEWMDKKGFASINDFKAKMNYTNIENPDVYFRIQFMKYFSGIE